MAAFGVCVKWRVVLEFGLRALFGVCGVWVSRISRCELR